MPDGRPSLGDIFGVQDDRPPLGAIFGAPDFSDVTGGVSSTADDLLRKKRAQMAQARQVAAAQGLAGPAPAEGVGDRLTALGDRFVSGAAEGIASIPELYSSAVEFVNPTSTTGPDGKRWGMTDGAVDPYPTIGKPGGFLDLHAQREDIRQQSDAARERLLASQGDPAVIAAADTLALGAGSMLPLPGVKGDLEALAGAGRRAPALAPAVRVAADMTPEEAAYLARRAAALRAMPGATEAPLRPGAVVDAMQPERSILRVGAHADDLSQDVALGLRARPQDAADAAELARVSQAIGEAPPPSLDDHLPLAGPVVDGRIVRPEIPNAGSISSSLDSYEVLPGVREVPMSHFDPEYIPSPYTASERARVDDLTAQIKTTGEINPLIVVYDAEQHPYILEGGHRFDALKLMGAKSLPAQVVIDTGETTAEDVARRLTAPRQAPPSLAEIFGDPETIGPVPESIRPVQDLTASVHETPPAVLESLPIEAAPRGDLLPQVDHSVNPESVRTPESVSAPPLAEAPPAEVPPTLRNLLTGEELPLDTPRARGPLVAPPSPVPYTGTTQALIEGEQRAAGLPVSERTTSQGPAWDEAARIIEHDPEAPRRLAREVAATPRPVSDVERHLLLQDRARLRPTYYAAMDAEEAALAGDPAQAAVAKTNRLAVENAYQVNADAAHHASSEWGKSGNAAQQLAAEDYSAPELVRRYRLANLGEEAPDPVRKKLVDVSRQLEAAQTRLAAAEERAQTLEAQRMIHSENQATAREIRSKGRAAVTAGLDQEYAGLSAEWRKATGLAQAGVNPDQAAILAKMARNRVRAGVTNLQDLVDGIFQDARPHLDTLEPRDVRDAIAGASPKAQAATKKAAVSEFTALRREARVLNALEDARAKLEAAPDSRARATLQKEVARWEAEAEKIAAGDRRGGGPLSDPERIRASLTRNATRQAELRDQIASGTVISKTRAPVADYPLIQARAETERLRREADAIIGRRELQNRSWLQKGLDLTAATARFVPLTSTTGTLPKLAFAAGSRSLMVRPAEQLLSALDPYLPLIREFSAEAPVEGGGVGFSALKKGYQGFFSTEAAAESLAHLKGEEGPLALALGKTHQPSGAPAFMDYPGHVHAAVKAPSVVSGYNWAMETQAKAFERVGREITPEMRQVMQDNAWEVALHDILLTDNAAVQRFNLALQKLPQDSRYTRVGIATIRSQLPIVKVPTNYAARLTDYLFGLPKAGFGMGEALIKGNSATKAMKALGEERTLAAIVHAGLQRMPPGSADYIMRNLKRGRLGAALAGLVLTGTVEVGGYYRKGEHRSENDLQPGEIRIPGARLQLPHNWLHNPAIESMQVVGTIQNSKDLYTGLKTSGHGIMEQIPFLEETQRVGLDLPNNPAKFAGMAARQISEPPDMQKLARVLDQEKERSTPQQIGQALGWAGLKVGPWEVPEIRARKRTPHGGFWEQLLEQEMLGVPGLRDNVR